MLPSRCWTSHVVEKEVGEEEPEVWKDRLGGDAGESPDGCAWSDEAAVGGFGFE